MPNVTAAGGTFRVDKPLYLRGLGCWLRAKTVPHRLFLLGPQGLVAQGNIKPLWYCMSQATGWCWAPITGTPPRLEPGVDYHLLAKAEQWRPESFPGRTGGRCRTELPHRGGGQGRRQRRRRPEEVED